MNNAKRKIFMGAKMLNGQASNFYVHANAHLLLELSEKEA